MNAKIRGWKFKFQSISPQIFINYRRMHVTLLIVGTTLTQVMKVDIANNVNTEVTGSLTWCTERSHHLCRFFPKCMTSVYSWETWDFPGGSVSKESACNAGDPGSIPERGKIPWRRKWQATPVFFPGESRGWRSLMGCMGNHSPWGRHRVGHHWVTNTHWSLSHSESGSRQRQPVSSPLLSVAWKASACAVRQKETKWTRIGREAMKIFTTHKLKAQLHWESWRTYNQLCREGPEVQAQTQTVSPGHRSHSRGTQNISFRKTPRTITICL